MSRGPRPARPASRSWDRSAIRQDRDAPAARATCCPAAPRTAPARPAGKPSGSRTRPATDARRRPTAPSSTARPRVSLPAYMPEQVASPERYGALGYRSSGGPSLGKRVQGELSGRLTVGAQDVPSQSTRPGFSVLGDGWERAAILTPHALGRRAARGLRHAMQARMADDGRCPRASFRPGAEHAAVRGRGVRPRGGRAARVSAHRAAVWIGLR